MTRSMERAAVRKSGSWICGVTEEGDVLYGKAVAAMRVFSHHTPCGGEGLSDELRSERCDWCAGALQGWAGGMPV